MEAGKTAAEREASVDATDEPRSSATIVESETSLVGLKEPTPLAGGYIGSAACRDCHQDRHDSFQFNDHHRSLRRPDEREEVEGQYEHAISHRWHQVTKRDGAIYHQATLRGEDWSLPLGTHQVQWVVGSGQFGKSYLTKDGTHWLQMPLTHYTEHGRYEMSPGSDIAKPMDFTRQITDQCLFCHAGSVRRKQNNPYDFEIVEAAIGCERCHGPGQEHVNIHTSDHAMGPGAAATARSNPDHRDGRIETDQIVHPRKLSRSRSDAICAQCHLLGTFSITDAAGNLWDFRPGQTLEAFRTDFVVSDPTDGVSTEDFLGHHTQMMVSECYLSNDSLRCISCHNPHQTHGGGGISVNDRLRHRRQMCLQCHQDADCTEAMPVRFVQQDQCHQCHMPKSDSEVPHASVTNHRIAIYRDLSRPPDFPDTPDRVDTPDEADTPGQRGVAHWASDLHSISLSSDPPPVRRKQLAQGRRLLNDGYDPDYRSSWESTLSRLVRTDRSRVTGDVDPELTVTLASLVQDFEGPIPSSIGTSPDAVLRAASMIERDDDVAMDLRVEAMSIIANAAFDAGQYAMAAPRYQMLTTVRRNASDWYNFGLTLAKLRRPREAAMALSRAIEIDPAYVQPYRSLQRLFERLHPEASQRYGNIADRLRSLTETETPSAR